MLVRRRSQRRVRGPGLQGQVLSWVEPQFHAVGNRGPSFASAVAQSYGGQESHGGREGYQGGAAAPPHRAGPKNNENSRK